MEQSKSIMDQLKEFFAEYIAMFVNYANFDDRTSVRGYWMAVLWNFVAALALGLIFGWSKVTSWIPSLYGLAVLVPGLAIAVRRLRDAGNEWTNIFWSFLPIAGQIILIVKLCEPSIAPDNRRVV